MNEQQAHELASQVQGLPWPHGTKLWYTPMGGGWCVRIHIEDCIGIRLYAPDALDILRAALAPERHWPEVPFSDPPEPLSEDAIERLEGMGYPAHRVMARAATGTPGFQPCAAAGRRWGDD